MKTHALLALPAVLCAALVAAVPSPAAYDQRPLHIVDPPPVPSGWRSLSHTIIETLWRPRRAHEKPQCHEEVKVKAPHVLSSLTLAQYGGDMVLRFNISNDEEATSFAEAADTLLLDVWDFSHNWVDIRLSTDLLPSLLGLLPASLQQSHVPLLRERELAQAIHDTYPIPRDQRRQPNVQPPSHLPDRRPFSPDLDPPNAADDNLFLRYTGCAD